MSTKERPQINLRIDAELLELMRAHCLENEISQTDFIVSAISEALGIKRGSDTYELGKKLALLEARIDQLENAEKKHRMTALTN